MAIELVKKRTNPLFIEFKISNLDEELEVLLLWEDDLFEDDQQIDFRD